MAAVELINSTLFSDANLVAYWRFEGNSNDSKGSHNGTDTSITYNTSNGEFGQGAGLNGSSSKISLSNNTDLNQTSITILAWVKETAQSNNETIFNNFFISTNRWGLVLRTQGLASNDTLEVLLCDGTAAQAQLDGTTAISDGNFHFIAFTTNGTNAHKTYVDGTIDINSTTSKTLAYNGASQVQRIGVQNFGSTDGQFWKGALDDMAIFSRVLSATEISNHWTGADATGGGSTSGAKSYAFFM